MTWIKIENKLKPNLIENPTKIICDKNNVQDKIEKTRFSISWKIIEIIEKSNKWDFSIDTEFELIKTWIKRLVKYKFKKNENWNSLSVFKNYFNLDDESDKKINDKRINDKFEKYFPIHFPILIENIDKEIKTIEKNEWKNIDNNILLIKKENLIKNILNKYTYILYIFWEKIKLWELNKNLRLDIEAIASLYSAVSKNIETIDKYEKNQINNSDSTDKTLSETDDNIFNINLFATTYRNIFKKVIYEGNYTTLIWSLKWVSEEIEKLFQLEFKKLFNVFWKWCDSNWKIWNDLYNLEKVLKKIIYGINIFKKLHIAFTKSFNWSITKPYYIYDINEVFLKQIDDNELDNKELKELFKNFMDISLKNWWKEKYEKLIIDITDFKRKTAESKIPKSFTRNENINIDNITFDERNEIPEEQKCELMFSKIIWNNWKIEISDYLELDKLDNDIIWLFTSSYWIDFEIVINQFKEIKARKNITIKDFIKEDINNLNLIMIWWKFLLKIKKIKTENKRITLKNISKIKENPYGIIEIISKKLQEKGIINSNKLTFKPWWKLNNISVETTTEQLKSIIKWFNKWDFDLPTIWIKISDSFILIKDLTNLYIPTENETNKKIDIDEEINNINDWLNSGIDLCFNLLKRETINNLKQKKYLKTLQKLNILPQNIENIEIQDLEKIQDLVETLKYIKKKIIKLKKMIDTWIRDKKTLENELFGLFENESDLLIKSWFWPQKSFTRSFIKLIKDYKWDFTLIWDLTRLRIIRKDIESLVKSLIDFIDKANNNENITHISIIDNIWEPISDSQKKSWYRDIKLLFSLKWGNVVELQFQYEEMLKLKEIWIDLHNMANENIINKIKKEDKLMTSKDLIEFLQFAKKTNMELPTKKILEKLLLSWNIDSIISDEWIDESFFKIKKINSTYTYGITRKLDTNLTLSKKITRLERALSDNAWSKAVIEYLINMNIKIT